MLGGGGGLAPQTLEQAQVHKTEQSSLHRGQVEGSGLGWGEQQHQSHSEHTTTGRAGDRRKSKQSQVASALVSPLPTSAGPALGSWASLC